MAKYLAARNKQSGANAVSDEEKAKIAASNKKQLTKKMSKKEVADYHADMQKRYDSQKGYKGD